MCFYVKRHLDYKPYQTPTYVLMRETEAQKEREKELRELKEKERAEREGTQGSPGLSGGGGAGSVNGSGASKSVPPKDRDRADAREVPTGKPEAQIKSKEKKSSRDKEVDDALWAMV